MYLQIDDATKILSLGSKEVTIIGILLLIIAGLSYAVIHLYKKLNKYIDKILEREKEHSNSLMEMNDENREVHNKYLMLLEIIKTKLFDNG